MQHAHLVYLRHITEGNLKLTTRRKRVYLTAKTLHWEADNVVAAAADLLHETPRSTYCKTPVSPAQHENKLSSCTAPCSPYAPALSIGSPVAMYATHRKCQHNEWIADLIDIDVLRISSGSKGPNTR